MKELIRRTGVLACLLFAICIFFYAKGDYLMVSSVDLIQDYRSSYITRTSAYSGLPSDHPMARREHAMLTVQRTKPVKPLAIFLDYRTENRLKTVGGPEWIRFFDQISSSAESAQFATRYSEHISGSGYLFQSTETPLSFIVHELKDKGKSHYYLKHSSSAGPRFMSLKMLDPDEARRIGAQASVIHPYRNWFVLPLLIGICLYFFMPKFSASSQALTYPVWYVSVRDLAGLIMAGTFFFVSFLVTVDVFHPQKVLFVSIFWVFGITCGLLILFLSAKMAAFSLEPLEQGIKIRTLRKNELIPYNDIKSIELSMRSLPEWVKKFMRVFVVFNPQYLGQLFAVSYSRDHIISLHLNDGHTCRFSYSYHFHKVDEFINELRAKGVHVSDPVQQNSS